MAISAAEQLRTGVDQSTGKALTAARKAILSTQVAKTSAIKPVTSVVPVAKIATSPTVKAPVAPTVIKPTPVVTPVQYQVGSNNPNTGKPMTQAVADRYNAQITAGKTSATGQAISQAGIAAAPTATGPNSSWSAQQLADYAIKNGVKNLQTLDWWKTNPNKQAAWDIIQKSTSPGTYPQTNIPINETVKEGDQTFTASGFNVTPQNWQDVKTPEDMNNFLNNLQDTEFKKQTDAENTPPVRGADMIDAAKDNNMSYFTDLLNPKDAAPALNAEQKLADLKKEQGTEPLETEITDLDSQIKDLEAAVRMQTVDEMGKPVAMGVIAGRISEEQRQAQEKMDFLQRKKAYAVDSLTTKYSVINQIMDAAKLDYSTATANYDKEYNRNLQAIDLMRDVNAEAKTDSEKAQDSARANFQILANSISSGAMDWTNATASQKLMAAKLELQAGLPSGTLENFSKKSSSGWELKTVLPGTDSSGYATATILQYNKATGEYKTSTIQTDYSSGTGTKNAENNILSKSERTDANGNKVLDVVYKDNTVKTIPLGATNTETVQSKEEQAFNVFRGDIIQKLYSDDPMAQITEETARKLVKARYPTMTTANIDKFLAI